jgi:hypothetical protein
LAVIDKILREYATKESTHTVAGKIIELAETIPRLDEKFSVFALIYILTTLRWTLQYVIDGSCKPCKDKNYVDFVVRILNESKYVYTNHGNVLFVISYWVDDFMSLSVNQTGKTKTMLAFRLTTRIEDEDVEVDDDSH